MIKEIIIYALIIPIMVLQILPNNTERVMNKGEIDNYIVTILKQLNCPYQVENIDKHIYADYRIIQESNLKLCQSWQSDNSIVEIYKGFKKDYLAIMRCDNAVYCAQYINHSNPDLYKQSEPLSNKIFYHESEFWGSGMYVGGRLAFFSDGTSIHWRYSYPEKKVATYITVNKYENLIATK